MEKARKLRRYNRKDYAQLVDFPVEIVGRDGVVRRYSFEESVRLYQRRIASAALRYEDGEVAEAEVQHCRRRIEQLRRSYFARYGWSEVTAQEGSRGFPQELAGEVAAFLRRTFPEDGAEALQFGALEVPGPEQLFAVQRMGEDGPEHYLLYLYRFAHHGTSPERDAFFRFIKILQTVRGSAEGVESLVAFHHTSDCGLVLTGSASPEEAEWEAAQEGGERLRWVDEEEALDPLRDGMVALRRGSLEEALHCFTIAYEGNPYRKAAYVWAVGVAEQLGEHGHAGMAALMGSRYFPTDPSLAYNLAVTHLHRGEAEEALAALAPVEALATAAGPVTLLKGLVALWRGDVRRGAALVRSADPLIRDDEDLRAAGRAVADQLRLRTAARLAPLVLVLGGALLQLWAFAAVGLLVSAGVAWMAGRVWRRAFEELVRAPSAKGLRLANPVAFRRGLPPTR